jgi:hypothetical protein
MTLNKALGALLAVQIIVLGTLLVMPSETRPQLASASQSFDHSNCQYPYRWTNPSDGCDNSDPAVPECIKAFDTEQGEKDCIAAFVAQHQVGTEEKQQAIAEHDAPFQEPTNQCGGK